jgi:fermentation-respiration switch protein FrsA (DUF1100 family)
MKKLLLTLTAFASLAIANINAADRLPLIINSNSGIVYTVTSARIASHYGSATATEGATYLLVKMTAKNTESKEQFLGGLFGSNFKVSQGSFSFDVDGGVGFQSQDAYSGIEKLTPLIPRTFIVAFTIPIELAKGEWTITTPTGNSFTVAAN